MIRCLNVTHRSQTVEIPKSNLFQVFILSMLLFYTKLCQNGKNLGKPVNCWSYNVNCIMNRKSQKYTAIANFQCKMYQETKCVKEAANPEFVAVLLMSGKHKSNHFSKSWIETCTRSTITAIPGMNPKLNHT